MDGRRFDDLARLYAAVPTRRGLLSAVAGGALGALLGAGEAAAACRPKGKTCGGSAGKCCARLRCCGGRCRDLRSDKSNCGACRRPCTAPGSACVGGACTWPPASWRPYADSSPFNTPIPANATPVANSAAIVARILGDMSKNDQPNNLLTHDDGSSGEPTYYARPTDPVYTLRCTMKQWGTCPIDGHKVRIPTGAQVEGGHAAKETNSDAYMNEPDAHLTVVDPATGWEYDLWQVHENPIQGGGELRFSWGGRARIDGDGLSADPDGHATAAHTASLAGRLRAEELGAGQINHALAVVLPCDNGTAVYPASGKGLPCNHSSLGLSMQDAPPMGSRLQLNMSAEAIQALPVPEWKKTLLRAMAKYGMFFMDTGTSGYFTIEQEAGNQYRSQGAPDKWQAVAQQIGWHHNPNGVPGYEIPHWVGSMRNDADGINWTEQVWKNLRVVHTPAPAAREGRRR